MTKLELGPHFEQYLRDAVASGRYVDESDVIRDALRAHEESRRRDIELLEALKADVADGIAEADAGLAQPYDREDILRRARNAARTT